MFWEHHRPALALTVRAKWKQLYRQLNRDVKMLKSSFAPTCLWRGTWETSVKNQTTATRTRTEQLNARFTPWKSRLINSSSSSNIWGVQWSIGSYNCYATTLELHCPQNRSRAGLMGGSLSRPWLGLRITHIPTFKFWHLSCRLLLTWMMTHILVLDDICHARQPKIEEVTEVAHPVTRRNPGIETDCCSYYKVINARGGGLGQ